MSIQSLNVLIQKTLPLVYDDSLSYLEILGKVVAKLNEMIDSLNEYLSQDLQEYVRLQLIEWQADGTLDAVITSALNTQVDDLKLEVGDLALLETTIKTDLVLAINEIKQNTDTQLSEQGQGLDLLKQRTPRVYNITEYGAVGEDAVLDVAGINLAIATAQADGGAGTIYFPAWPKTFYTNQTIVIPRTLNCVMETALIYTGGIYEPCLQIGELGARSYYRHYKLWARNLSQADWQSENSVGIKLCNIYHADIEIVASENFTVGVQCIGSGASGFVYNNVRLSNIQNNKIGLDLTQETNGWCNENIFTGGRFWCASDTRPGLDRIGVRITSKDLTYTNNNNNNFYKPSFELHAGSGGEALPILLEYGRFNRFINYRDEGNSPVPARILNDSTDHTLIPGYRTGGSGPDDQSTAPTSFYQEASTPHSREAQTVIFDSGPLAEKACFYDGSSSVNVPGIVFYQSGMNDRGMARTSINIESDYLDVASTRGIGIRLDTTQMKRFVVKRNTGALPGRVGVRCYDSSGTLLTNAGSGHPYVRGSGPAPLDWNTAFGGIYRRGSDASADVFFMVGPDVASVDVILHGGTDRAYIKAFSVLAVDSNTAKAFTGWDHFTQNIGTVAPTAGTWTAGRIVINATPTAGGPIGWVCITSGTPGTWKAFGTVSS